MLPYEATLVVTLRLPISLDAEDRDAAHSQMQARVAEARSAGALESVRVDDLVAILAHSDPSRTIPVRRVSTDTEEVCEDRTRILRRPLGDPVWHCFEARGMRHVGSGADPDDLWQAASGRDVAAFRTRLPADWRSPAWAAASEHVRDQARAGIDGPVAAARRNEFLRGVRHAVELHGPPACYQHLWTDAFYGFRWAVQRMETVDTPEHQRLVQLEVSGEIPIARMRTPNAGAVYCGGDHDGVPAEVGHSVWRCLWQATNKLGGSANRWRARAAIRQTDEQLQRALASEFGLATYSYSGPHGTWETNPGTCPAAIDPVFRQGILDSGRKVSRTEWRHTFRGPELLRHVRALLRIPDPGGHIPDVPLWEEALQDLVRLPRRGRVAAAPCAPPCEVATPPPVAQPADLALSLFS